MTSRHAAALRTLPSMLTYTTPPSYSQTARFHLISSSHTTNVTVMAPNTQANQ